MWLRPLDGSSCHLQIQIEGCGRARGPPAWRKLGQSQLVTSLLMEAASSVWIFLYCRRQCKKTSWLLSISQLIIWPAISLYLQGIGPGYPDPPSQGTVLSPTRPIDPSFQPPHSPSSAMLEVHFLSCLYISFEFIEQFLLIQRRSGHTEKVWPRLCLRGKEEELQTAQGSSPPLPPTSCLHWFWASHSNSVPFTIFNF